MVSVLLRHTDPDYPFGIFKLFLATTSTYIKLNKELNYIQHLIQYGFNLIFHLNYPSILNMVYEQTDIPEFATLICWTN